MAFSQAYYNAKKELEKILKQHSGSYWRRLTGQDASNREYAQNQFGLSGREATVFNKWAGRRFKEKYDLYRLNLEKNAT